MPIPDTPTSMDEFNTKAKEFVKKAKEAGKSNTAIANTLQFMYQMTVENMKSSDDVWDIVKDDNGNLIWVNKKTQESKNLDSSGGFDFSQIENDQVDSQSVPDLSINSSGEIEDFFNSGNSGETSQESQNQDVLKQLYAIDNPGKYSSDPLISSYGTINLNPFQNPSDNSLYLSGESSINSNLKKNI